MKILYGIQGTGNGHITRARALSTELAKACISVDYVFSGRTPDQYFNMEPFGDYKTFRGLTFATRNGQIGYMKTVLTNNIINLAAEIKSLSLDQYDLVITDFEPVTAWAAKRHNKTSLGVGHQYAFDYDIPVEGSNWISRQIMKWFAPASLSLGVHWYHFGNPILPPIIEPPLENVTRQQGKILVYLPFENIRRVCRWLEQEHHYEFYVYHPVSRAEDSGNIHLRPLSRDQFQADLVSCDGVITNSGFELASEAIQYGKKILTKPLRRQMEQISNAAALRKLKRADVICSLDPAVLQTWLSKKSPQPRVYPNVAREIVRWIVEGRVEPLEVFTRRLWRSCESEYAFLQPDARYCVNER
jgi:uncharacterized protein (TIGR00661 family)